MADYEGGLLRFAGERHSPLLPHEVAARRPHLGTNERPDELEELAGRRSVYIHSSAESEPAVEVNAVAGQDGLYRVDVPVDPDRPGALLGKTGERRKPEDYLDEIEADVDFRGHRPDWVDHLPVPRTLPEPTAPLMERLDGRRLTRPFQTTRFPPEERQVFQDASWPWGLVGKLFNSNGFNGSAMLVGPRVVVTAGHMCPWGASGWWMRFVPAYYDGSSLHGTGVESYVSDFRGYDVGGDVCGYDWAVLRLYEPLGDWLGWFGFNGYDDDWEDDGYWTVVGYPGAIAGGQRPSYQTGVSVFDDDSDSNGGMELETRADMGPGNSGGPMFGWWGDDPRILGDVSGEEYDSALGGGEWGNVVAGGSGLSNLISWARGAWPL